MSAHRAEPRARAALPPAAAPAAEGSALPPPSPARAAERVGPAQEAHALHGSGRQGLTPLPDNWIEAFHCPACNSVLYWRLSRGPGGDLSLLPLPAGVQAQLQQRDIRP